MAYAQENLSQKTLVADTTEEIDKLCEEFRLTHTVRFTQSNDQVFVLGETAKIKYIRVMFYIQTNIKPEVKPEPVQKPTTNNNNSEAVVEEKIQDTPAQDAATASVEAARRTPKQDLWKSCEECGQRIKYSSFNKCRCGREVTLTAEEAKLKEENFE